MLTQLRITLSFAVCLGLLVLAAITFPVPSEAVQQTQPQKSQTKRSKREFVPGEVLVRYRTESQAKSKTTSAHIAAVDGTLLQVELVRTKGADLIEGLRLARVAPEDTLKAVAALRNQPDVLYAEPNYILHATATPNDTHFGLQYGLTKIGAPQAWDTRTGSSGNNRIVVAVVDQGIDGGHDDLQPNIWVNPGETPGNGVDDDGNGFIDDINGWNFHNDNATIFSGNSIESHATHVAGIIGAVGNNNKGVAGVNWSVGLMSLKFLDASGGGSTSNAVDACAYARQMRQLWNTQGPAKGANVRVINASFGGDIFTDTFQNAVRELNNAGILFVAAAGNIANGTREPNNDLVPHFPSNFDSANIIAVASTNDVDGLSTLFSHFGPTSVDLGAPGEDILSTTPKCPNPGLNTCQPDFPFPFTANDYTYTFFDGTSMSTPYVSGSAALLWGQNPNLTVQQVKRLLLYNGDLLPALANKTLTGRRLNVGKSFEGLNSGDSTPPGTVGSFHISSQNGRNVNVGWTASGDDGATGQASQYELSFTDTSSGQVFPLKGVLPRASGALQRVNVAIPFRHLSGTLTLREFDNAGNEGTPVNLPVGVPLSAGDPYTIAVGAPAPLSTGGNINQIDADDRYVDSLLPFSFPFFGENFTSVTISSNGALYFSAPPRRCPFINPNCTDADADDPPGSPRSLGGYKMIAGLWEDLDLRVSERPDAGVYLVTPNPNQIIFRWQGVPCNFNGVVCLGGAPINFEIELNSNGVIKSRYGAGNTNLIPTVGIGGGAQDGYAVQSHTSEVSTINLTNAGEVTYIPRAQSVSTVQLAQAAMNVNENANFVRIDVTRTGDLASFATVNYRTSDTAGLTNCTVAQGKASERCDYETGVGTLRFSTGEATKSIFLPIVNDVLVEGNETFNITLSSVTGAGLGTSTGTVTIVDNDTTPANSNPIDDIPFFVTQQYIDFLGRLPDSVGFANWVATLSACPNGGFGEFDNPGCDRVHVSAGFFLSQEFQIRGYFAYRYYEVALDRRPTYAEFVPDMAQVGGDQSPESEVLSKAAYTDEWTQRTEFKNRYDAMTNSQYVNALEVNAEVNVANKAALIAALDSGQKTRGEVLREIVESQVVADKFFNRAFVSMQYFGYLRRDPDTVGFQNWLTTLNNNPADFRHMIFGFLFSTEYRQRFGP